MAWLQNLAGKAEDLLVKIDQNAATVLNDSNQVFKELNFSNISANHLVRIEESNPKTIISDLDTSVSILNENLKEIKTNDVYVSNHIETRPSKSDPSENTSVSTDDDDGLITLSSANSVCGLPEDFVSRYEDKILLLEKEIEELKKQSITIRHSYSELENENLNLHSRLGELNETLSKTLEEMEQYRARARRILEEKASEIGAIEFKDELYLMTADLEKMKNKLEISNKSYTELVEKYTELQNQFKTLQYNFTVTRDENQAALTYVKDLLANERKIKVTLEEECVVKNKELQSASNMIFNLRNSLEQSNQELISFRKQINNPNSMPTNEEFENRLQTLTQALMSKQDALEATTTEKHALRLQLEKLDAQHQKTISALKLQLQNSQQIEEPFEIKSHVPQFLKVSPFDAGVTRQVKHAYSSLDSVSIRTGVFLRRHPLARVFVFCYMILLHIWVLVILCTDVPDNTNVIARN